MGATVVQYPTPTLVSGSLRTLSATPSAAASNSKISVPALSVLAVVRRYVPETTSSSTTAIPTTFDSVGWQMDTDIVPLSDAGVTRASSITVRCALIANQATPTTITVALFIGGVQVGTTTAGASTSVGTAQSNVDLVVNVAAGTTIPAGGRLQLAVSASCTNASVTTASTVTLLYTSTGSTVGALTYTINSSRTGSDSTNQTDTARSGGSTYSRTATDTESALTDSTARVASYVRTGPNSTTASETAIRNAIFNKTGADTLSATVDTASRVSTDYRRGTDNQIPQVDTASRSISLTLTASESTSQSDVASKTITYMRVTLYQFQPGDEPASAQTRAIRGYILNSDHTPFTTGATVMLIRDDGVVVQTQTSAQDGSYVFPRNFLDTHTYTVAAFATVSGSPVEAITERGLAPV